MRWSYRLNGSRAFLLGLGLALASGLVQSADAKTLEEGAVPVNLPPSDFQGRAFVDNDGCVYLRAGVGGATSWVPRVSRDRRVICGQRPTFGNAAASVAVAAAPRAAPARTVVAAAPVPRALPSARPQRRSGSFAVSLPPIPEGYRQVWEDGRLNPLRGLPKDRAEASRNARLAAAARSGSRVSATRTGAPASEQLAGMIDPKAASGTKKATTKQAQSGSIRISAKAPAAGLDKAFIQVATFKDLTKAKRAAQIFADKGLATRIGRFTRFGQDRQVVILGPFSSLKSRQSALNIARTQGFSKAVLRK